MRDWAFWLWALVGAALALSAFSLGPLLGLPVLLAIVLLAHPWLVAGVGSWSSPPA
jgi:hypothetical protein